MNFETGQSFQKIRKLLNFRKNEPFKRKFRKFQEASKMEHNFPITNFRKLRYTSQSCPLFRKFREMQFHSLEMQTRIFGRTEEMRYPVKVHTTIHPTRARSGMHARTHEWPVKFDEVKDHFLLHKTWRKAIIILYITSGLTYIFHLSNSTFIILSLYVHPFLMRKNLSLLVANSKLLSYWRIKSLWFNLYTAIAKLWYREIVAIIREQMHWDAVCLKSIVSMP